MITLPPQSRIAWTVGVTILHAAAISATIYRLVHRFRSHRTWWDDYIVFLPLVLDVVYCITFWFRNPLPYVPHQPLKIQVLNSFWMTGFIFMTIIWSTRTVLALSLVRIFTIGRARKWTIALSVAMGVAWASSIIINIAACRQTNGFLRVNAKKDCLTAHGVPVRSIYLATVDFTGDLLLVITPLILFWRVRLPQAERRLILAVFCGSVLTLLSVVSYISITLNPHINLGKDGGTIAAGLSQIEAGISLFVCNLAVVTTCLYRSIRNKRHPPSLNATPARTRPARPSCSCSLSTEKPTTLSLTEISDFSMLPESPQATLSAEKSSMGPRELFTTFEEQKSSEGSDSQV